MMTTMATKKSPTISSLAAPSSADLAAFEKLSAAEKKALLKAEIEQGLAGAPRKASADDIIKAVRARLADA